LLALLFVFLFSVPSFLIYTYKFVEILLPAFLSVNTTGSGITAWWICEKGHEFDAIIGDRKKRGCPYCSNHRINEENCLANLVPDLLAIWDYEKNEISPHGISKGSGQVVSWKCNEGHMWVRSIYDQQNRKNILDCPECKKQIREGKKRRKY